MIGHEGDGPGPGGQGVDGLNRAEAAHDSDGVAGATGCPPAVLGYAPSLEACCRFTSPGCASTPTGWPRCIDCVLGYLSDENPAMGEQVAHRRIGSQ